MDGIRPASARRAIFLDVDGTYAHHGIVPPAHEAAVRAARAAGHVVFLCTGRPVSLLPPHLTAAGFDGIVAGAGAHVTVGDDVVLDIRFPAPLAARALSLLDAVGTHYLLETPEGTFARQGVIDVLSARAALSADPAFPHLAGLVDIVAALTPLEDLSGVGIGKITAFDGPVSMAIIAAELGDEVAMFPSSIADLGVGAGELYLARVNKAVGMEAAIARLGIARADTIAFGDNLNDLEMIEFAGVGVAMATGMPEVIAAANLVTPGPDEDGIATAFAELGLTQAGPERASRPLPT
jgi:Cof subfamily protein (haloacid dehalogenase superfamily)